MHRIWVFLSTYMIVMVTLIASVNSSAEAGKGVMPPRLTIKSVQPNALRLHPGTQGKAEIKGENLDLAKTVIAKSGRSVSQEITGKLTCKQATQCTVELIASAKAKPQAYTLILADGDRRDLAVLPIKFEIIINRQLTIKSVKPQRLRLNPGEAGKVEISGTNLNVVTAALVRQQRRTTTAIKTQFTCKSSTSCRLDLGASKQARPGAYETVLIDKSQTIVATLPLILEILDPRLNQPQREITIKPEPGHSIQYSCIDGTYSTDTTLLEPEAGTGLAVGSELVWGRADHEICGQSVTDKRYVLAICNSPHPSFDCNPGNGLYYSIRIDPNVMGNGRCEIIPDDATPEDGACQLTLAEIAESINGVQPGDTIYWQMRYRADAFQDIYGDFTEKRPLLFDVTPEEPEPEPSCPSCPPPPTLFSPADGSRMHATNKNFFWSDESPPNTPNDPNFPDWTWDVCLMKPPSETCVGGGPFKGIDNSLTGLSYYEFNDWGLIGGEIRWKVKACNQSGLCGGYSASRSAYIPLAPAERVYPVNRAEVSPGRTFIWRAVEGADFYQLVISRSYDDADGFQGRHLVRQLDETEGTSVHLTTLDLEVLDKVGNTIPNEHLGRVSTWSVRSCYDPDGPGAIDPVCSDHFFAPFESFGGSSVTFTNTPTEPGEVSFDALVDTFRSPSCVNCHTVAATNFQIGGDSVFGLPSGHPQVNAQTTCTNCHANTLLPPGTHDIPWHAAPATMDFRAGPGVLKPADMLCAMGQNPGTVATDAADHLAGDPLILWAVSGGPLPFNSGNGVRGFAGTLEEWQQLVQDWFAAGMPCEKPD